MLKFSASFLAILFLLASTSEAQIPPSTPNPNNASKTPPVEAPKDTTELKGDKKIEAQSSPYIQETPLKVQKIVVTGSYIRQAANNKAPSPVKTINNSRFQETAGMTIASALSESPLFNNVDSGAFLAMHGQSSADNLVLLNGMRLPKTAGGTAVNIDFLPSMAAERVDVLKDGASALYGSEALAGVVNIVTRKDLDRGNFLIRHTRPPDGNNADTNLALSYGKTFTHGYLMGVLQYKHEDPLYYRDTKYRIYDITQAGSVNSSPGSLTDTTNGRVYRDPACPAGRFAANGPCRMDSTKYAQFPDGNREDYYNFFLSGGYKFTPQFNIDALTIFTRRTGIATGSPVAAGFGPATTPGGTDYSIPQVRANEWLTGAGSSNTVNGPAVLNYGALEELGLTQSRRDVDSYINQFRLYGEINDKWDWDFAMSQGLTYFKDVTFHGNANKEILYQRITATPNTFNPFKPSGAKDFIADAAYQPWFEHSSRLLDTRLILTGEIGKINGRPVNIGFGGENQWTDFYQHYDPLTLQGKVLGSAASNQEGQRTVDSTFLEVTHSPIKKLDVQIAGRFDNYSDFGYTTNPKLAAAFHPSEKVTFRSSYGTGFKAPDLLSIFQGSQTSLTTFRDEVVCQTKGESDPRCRSGTYAVTTVGNKNLRPETATHYNFGLILTPQKSLTMTMDYWAVDGKAGLSPVTPYNVTRGEAAGQAFAPGFSVTRDSDGYITGMSTPARINSGIFKMRGLDINIEKKMTAKIFGVSGIQVRLETDHSHILSSGGKTLSSDPFRRATDFSWKNFSSATFSKGKHFSKFMVRTFAARDKYPGTTAGVNLGTTPFYSEYDVHYENYITSSTTLSFGVKNIFDTMPISDAAGIVSPAMSNSYGNGTFLGRTFYAGISQDF